MDLYLGTILIWPVSWIPESFIACDGSILGVNQNQALFSLMGGTFGGDGSSTFGIPDLRGRVPVGAGVAATGTTYTFAKSGGLEKVPVSMQIPGNTQIATGFGTASGNLTITAAQMPAHSHQVPGVTFPISIPANTAGGNTDTPGNTAVLAKGTVVGGPVNTTAKSYTTVAPNSNLEPFDVTVPGSYTTFSGNGSSIPIKLNVDTNVITSDNGISLSTSVPIMQPYLVLNYMICTSGIYPPRP